MQKDQDQVETFLDLYDAVCKFSTDIHEERSKLRRIPRFFHVSQDNFFKDLYVERGRLEKRILDRLDRDPGLMCIAGPLGSGKTSTGQKVLRRFESNHKGHAFTARFDLRARTREGLVLRFDGRPITDGQALGESLELEVYHKYMDQLFPYYTHDSFAGSLPPEAQREKLRLWNLLGGRNPQLALYSYLLDSSLDSSRPQYLFEAFSTLRNTCLRAMRAFRKGQKARRDATYYDWLLAISEEEGEFDNIEKEIVSKIRVQHVIYAATELYGYDHQLIWFDNADALVGRLQAEIFHILRRLQLTISEYARVLISVRAENIKKYDLLEQGAPPAFELVLIDPTEPSTKIPTLRVPPAQVPELKGIIRKRFEFAQRFQQSRIAELKQRIKARSPDDSANIPEIQRLMARYGAVLSAKEAEDLRVISEISLDVCERQNAIYLANGSLRGFLALHREFTRHLHAIWRKAPKGEAEKLLSDENRWYLDTLFLRFSRSWINHFQVGIYDIIQAAHDWFKRGKPGVGCFLKHVIITSTWNLEMERFQDGVRIRYPTVGEVIDRIGLLGYQGDSEIRVALFELYEHDGESGHIIDFHAPEEITAPEKIVNGLPCLVTYRAQCLSSSTCNSFGYIYECVERLTNVANGKGLSLPSTRVAMERVLPFLCDIAEMHIEELTRLRGRNPFGQLGASWVQEYRRLFGVRLDRRFRITEAGDQNHGVYMAMLFEALVASVEAYVKRHAPGEGGISTLKGLYEDSLRLLENGLDPTSDFRHLMGLPPRS
ncbi:MAG: hypothetical protein K0U98_26380 [Deltaproteobacteria bacterium]|nr:hypothetical protein [Deltaproteobacteria bacterium]